jgi:UDP-GlcNAc:undecaprenyl-phosphate/decaprenyl-phosphate GlcNAc-1-phosphate transferase
MYYVLIFVMLLLLLNVYFKVADHFNIIDKPNYRSSHKEITIRGGGIIFSLGAISYFIFSGFQFPYFILGLLIITIVSFADDVKTLSGGTRLIAHLVSVALLFYQLNLFTLHWWILLVALIVTIGILNAYNFMDGINGITGGYSLAILAGLWLVNTFNFHFVDNGLIFSVAIAVFIFDIYNFRKKARCFAGDVGSVSIAFILIFLLGKLIFESENIIYIFFLMLYGIDSILTIIQRLFLKENIFQPHRKHFYQLLANEAHISHSSISIGYTLVQLFINIVLVMLLPKTSPTILWLLIFFLLAAFTSLYILVKRKYDHLISSPITRQ